MAMPMISAYLLKNASQLSDAVGVRIEKLGCETLTHHVNWGPGVSTGEVTIETADEVDYTGTWAPIAVVPSVGSTPRQDFVITQAAFAAIRHRVSQPLHGGTVTTKIIGS